MIRPIPGDSMFVAFDEIPADGLALDHEVRVVESGEADEVFTGPARLVGGIRRGSRGLDLEARLTTRVRLECSRCLEPYDRTLEVDVYLVVVSQAAEFGVGEKRVAAEDAVLFYADRGRVDLREIAREQILLNLPLKPVCREDCAGLCPTCGANRNRIECPCRPDEGDSRLAPLLAFKKEDGRP